MTDPVPAPAPRVVTRHARVAHALIEDIARGRYAVGTRLPTEADLERRFGVSRHTVRQAIRHLRDLGLVTARAGIGTTVMARESEPRAVLSMNSVDELLQFTKNTRLRLLAKRELAADEALARTLRCRVGEAWLQLQLLRTIPRMREPLGLVHVWVRPEFSGIADQVDKVRTTVFAILQRRYGVATDHHAPTIPYLETITSPADGHHRHKKQSGGRGQFAEVYLRVKPRGRGEGFEYIDGVVGGSVPRQFIPEVEKGVRKFLVKGALAGFPVVDVAAELYDGKYHEVDSDQISFQIAGERAFADGYAKARPILLEPILDVEIAIPEPFFFHSGINLRVGCDPSQIFDLLLGVIGLDLYQDDAYRFNGDLRFVKTSEEEVPEKIQY